MIFETYYEYGKVVWPKITRNIWSILIKYSTEQL